jgi:ATP-dependent DNA helicase RecQ
VSDPIVIARKVLSAVARVDQRFGAAHVTNVLRGAKTEQVISRGHDRLSVFGLLQAMPVDEVRGYVEQLVALELLAQVGDEFPILRLTGSGVALMKDAGAEPDLALARQRKPEKGKAPRRSRPEGESWDGVDRELFERLRALRLRVARERGVPPYVIFHDATLRELARLKPQSLDALRHVYGVGVRKVDDFGAVLLDEIRSS